MLKISLTEIRSNKTIKPLRVHTSLIDYYQRIILTEIKIPNTGSCLTNMNNKNASFRVASMPGIKIDKVEAHGLNF